MSTKLGNLGIELLGLAAAVQKLVEDGTTFAAVRPGPGLLPPQTLAGTDAVPGRDGRFTLGGSATAQLQISAVKDPGSNQDDAQILQSAPSCAWLKHELDARIDGTLGGPLGSGGAAFGLEGELGGGGRPGGRAGGEPGAIPRPCAHRPGGPGGDRRRPRLPPGAAAGRR